MQGIRDIKSSPARRPSSSSSSSSLNQLPHTDANKAATVTGLVVPLFVRQAPSVLVTERRHSHNADFLTGAAQFGARDVEPPHLTIGVERTIFRVTAVDTANR